MKDKILLHCCCAPCATYPLEKLSKDNFEPVIYFYNPNIYPKEEYEIRRNELKNYSKMLNIEYIEGDFEPTVFQNKVKGYEKCLEKGERCSICFLLRLTKTAQMAKKMNIKFFTTTLSVSPHKNSNQIFIEGKKAQSLEGVEFLEYNFKKEDGFKISRQIASKNNMYAQKYCGCKYSIRN